MDKFKRSLLPDDLRGVVLVYSGQYGSGKSLAALLDPPKTVFIDADFRKGENLKPILLDYHPVNSDDSEDLVKTGELFIDAVAKIDKSKTTVVVIDNLFEAEQGVHAYAVVNPVKLAKMYNLIATNISSRAYGHDVLVYERIIKGIVNELLANKITVILISHMKDKFMAAGQKEIKARKWIYEAASLVAIMQRTAAAPDVVVFKSAFSYVLPVDVNKLTDGEFIRYRMGEIDANEIIPRIPRRIPGFTPRKLFAYLAKTPDQLRNTPFLPEETLEDSDIAPYSEMLSKWQLANIEKIMEAEEEERKAAKQFEENIRISQRAELDKTIIESQLPVVDLIRELRIKFELFADEINPMYIAGVRGKGGAK